MNGFWKLSQQELGQPECQHSTMNYDLILKQMQVRKGD